MSTPPMSAADRAYMRDPSNLKALRTSNDEAMKRHVEKIRAGLRKLKREKPRDNKRIAETEAVLEKAKHAGYGGGKRTFRKRKSRKSKKGKTAKKRRH